MVEAFRDLATSEVDKAIEILDLVLRTYEDLPNAPHAALPISGRGAHTE
jgi:hypothetical protein